MNGCISRRRASLRPQEPGLAGQRHGPLPAVDASQRLGRQEGRHLQRAVPAVRRSGRRQRRHAVRALRAGPALHPQAARPDRHVGGHSGLRHARQLHLPRGGGERRLGPGLGCALAGQRQHQHSSSRYVAGSSGCDLFVFFAEVKKLSLGEVALVDGRHESVTFYLGPYVLVSIGFPISQWLL